MWTGDEGKVVERAIVLKIVRHLFVLTLEIRVNHKIVAKSRGTKLPSASARSHPAPFSSLLVRVFTRALIQSEGYSLLQFEVWEQ
jgi:hypothetical protein